MCNCNVVLQKYWNNCIQVTKLFMLFWDLSKARTLINHYVYFDYLLLLQRKSEVSIWLLFAFLKLIYFCIANKWKKLVLLGNSHDPYVSNMVLRIMMLFLGVMGLEIAWPFNFNLWSLLLKYKFHHNGKYVVEDHKSVDCMACTFWILKRSFSWPPYLFLLLF